LLRKSIWGRELLLDEGESTEGRKGKKECVEINDDVIVRIIDAEVAYGAIRALHGVTLDIRRGQLVALIGANAAGKSTLLRGIAGLVSLTRGRIEVPAGRDIAEMPSHRRVRQLGIALVPEGRGILTRLTVQENLAMGSKIGRLRSAENEDARAAQRLSAMFEVFPLLYSRRKLHAGHLSGGEQQMLAIGRALLMEPDLLLVDEPSVGLAPLVVRQIVESLRELLEMRRTTILLAEQNTELALKVADYAYVLKRGEIVLSGPPDEVENHSSLHMAYLSA
jgi:branched-chain amino acid transport system ATP-binding protein